MGSFVDWKGKRQGKLVVVEYAGKEGKHYLWKCVCDCGAEVVKTASALSGGTKSCSLKCGVGAANKARTKHGRLVGKHGAWHGDKLYSTWQGIKQRCFNPEAQAYPWYGGRGITMHPAWVDDFAQFAADMGEPPSDSHSIDRIRVAGNYEPGNVRWVTTDTQGNNRSSNTVITHMGETRTLSEWAEALDVPYMLLMNRYIKGRRGADLLMPRQAARSDTPITHNGERRTLMEWSEVLDVPYPELYERFMATGGIG